MPDQKTIELIQQEVHTPNNDRLYQATKKEVENNKLVKAKAHKELEAIAKSARDNTSELDEETKDRMTEFIKTNSKATLMDIIKKFYSK